MNLTIKKVPLEVYEHLKSKSASKGQSLNAEIIQVLAAEAAEAARRQRMRETRRELEAFVSQLPKMRESAPLVREDRER